MIGLIPLSRQADITYDKILGYYRRGAHCLSFSHSPALVYTALAAYYTRLTLIFV